MLKEIRVEGFRGFATEAVLRLALPTGAAGSGLTLVVGPNNSGKSSLLELFKYRKGYQSPTFNVGMRNRATDSVAIYYEFDDRTESVKSIRRGSSESVLNGLVATENPFYYVPSRRYFSPYFGRSNPLARADFMTNYSSQTQTRSPTISSFEGRLMAIERDQEKFNLLLRRVMPDILNWSIDASETGQHFLKFASKAKMHSSEGVGEGVISLFVIMSALYDSNPRETIIIDEPELSLHPQIQRRLAALLEEFAKDRQIVLATHSPYFVSSAGLRHGATVVRTWDRDGIIELYQVNSDTGAGALKSLLSINVNNPHVFGLDAKEVFFLEDRVLVFEGQEDVVLWPNVMSSGHSADTYNVYGWGAGGAANISNVCSVLSGLGYRRVAAVLDNDRPQDLASLRIRFPDFLFVNLPTDDIRTKKAVAAKPPKKGLLDDKLMLRAEYQEQVEELHGCLSRYMASHDAD